MKRQAKLRHVVPLGFFFLALAPAVFAARMPLYTGTTGVPEKIVVQVQNRLTQARLRACQAKENAIRNRAKHLGDLATTMEKTFDAIAKRVEDYYTTKVVPSGKTVAGYDSLVGDIATKKTAVQTALTKAQTDAEGFACDSTDPKGQLTQFREDMQAVKSALKDYRTSIKNLIVAVRSVTGAPTPTGL